MNDKELKQAISKLASAIPGYAGIYAETLGGGQRVGFNADEIFPAASSIKVFVLFTLLNKAEAGQLALDERLEYTSRFSNPGSGVLAHLGPGLNPTLQDLATLMMMISDNSALSMLTDYLGLDVINETIARLELENTHIGDWSDFKEASMDSMSLGKSTPQEFVSFLLRMSRGELLSEASSIIFWDTLRIQKYIEPLRRYLPASPWAREFDMPEPTWVASKNGNLEDCATESGLITVKAGGWAISVMTRDMPSDDADMDNTGEQFISDVSLAVYQAWSPLFD
jgi:beta-lactamase class A